MFFCSVEMLPDWAICKEDTLQFCLIRNRRGAYLWRRAFLHNAANRKWTCLCAKTFPRLLVKGSESSTPCLTPAPPPCILSCKTLPQTCSCLLPLWQRAFLMVRLGVLLELFIHFLAAASGWQEGREPYWLAWKPSGVSWEGTKWVDFHGKSCFPLCICECF